MKDRQLRTIDLNAVWKMFAISPLILLRREKPQFKKARYKTTASQIMGK